MRLECKFCKYLDPSVEGYCYMFETEPDTKRKCAQCTPPDCAAGLEMFTKHVCESFGSKVEELKDLPGAPCYLCGDVEGEVKPDCDAAGEDLEPGASCPVCSGEELDTGISAPLA